MANQPQSSYKPYLGMSSCSTCSDKSGDTDSDVAFALSDLRDRCTPTPASSRRGKSPREALKRHAEDTPPARLAPQARAYKLATPVAAGPGEMGGSAPISTGYFVGIYPVHPAYLEEMRNYDVALQSSIAGQVPSEDEVFFFAANNLGQNIFYDTINDLEHDLFDNAAGAIGHSAFYDDIDYLEDDSFNNAAGDLEQESFDNTANDLEHDSFNNAAGDLEQCAFNNTANDLAPRCGRSRASRSNNGSLIATAPNPITPFYTYSNIFINSLQTRDDAYETRRIAYRLAMVLAHGLIPCYPDNYKTTNTFVHTTSNSGHRCQPLSATYYSEASRYIFTGANPFTSPTYINTLFSEDAYNYRFCGREAAFNGTAETVYICLDKNDSATTTTFAALVFDVDMFGEDDFGYCIYLFFPHFLRGGQTFLAAYNGIKTSFLQRLYDDYIRLEDWADVWEDLVTRPFFLYDKLNTKGVYYGAMFDEVVTKFYARRVEELLSFEDELPLMKCTEVYEAIRDKKPLKDRKTAVGRGLPLLDSLDEEWLLPFEDPDGAEEYADIGYHTTVELTKWRVNPFTNPNLANTVYTEREFHAVSRKLAYYPPFKQAEHALKSSRERMEELYKGYRDDPVPTIWRFEVRVSFRLFPLVQHFFREITTAAYSGQAMYSLVSRPAFRAISIEQWFRFFVFNIVKFLWLMDITFMRLKGIGGGGAPCLEGTEGGVRVLGVWLKDPNAPGNPLAKTFARQFWELFVINGDAKGHLEPVAKPILSDIDEGAMRLRASVKGPYSPSPITVRMVAKGQGPVRQRIV
ncbi:hypothetical protein V8F20_012698 [Naviculisporaceae sp. PSN 640]